MGLSSPGDGDGSRGGNGNRNVQKTFREFRRCALFRSHKSTRSPLYTDNAKPPKGPSILWTECELRQQGARRRGRHFGADCIERRSGN
eukprot:2101826-Pleurochrysis_carterae.AAC.1